MFEKVLIANRGEIALRIHRACKEMGIATVAVHSTADAEAMHVRLADESVCIGPPAATESYLNIPAIVSAATVTAADAIHPGYGFLSENANFAHIVEEHGFAFIGPKPEHIAEMGDKVAAKAAMRAVGVPVVPGTDGSISDAAEAARVAEEIGYPLMVRPSFVLGGRAMEVIHDEQELRCYLAAAVEVSPDRPVLIDKFLENAIEVEADAIADGVDVGIRGALTRIHLNETLWVDLGPGVFDAQVFAVGPAAHRHEHAVEDASGRRSLPLE